MLSLLQISVKDFLNIHQKKVLIISPEMSFKELTELFKKHEENFAIVQKEGKPVGIVTERDIARAYLDEYPLDMPIYHIAKKELVKINSSSSLLEAFNLMTENYIRRLVVVNENGEFEGMLTQQDLILYSTEELFQGVGHIRDLLDRKSELIFASSEETLKEAIEKMVKYNIGALPILDEEGKPIGIVTEKDLINFCESDLKKLLREVALKKVITVKASDYLLKGIRLFKEYKIRHLVVVDEGGRAINLISQRDFIQNLVFNYIEFIQSQLNQAKNLLSLIPEIVIEVSECDSECKVIWMNDFAKKKLGEEYLGKDILTFIDYDDWNRIYGLLKREKILHREKIRSLTGIFYEITGTYLELGKEGKIKLILREIVTEVLKERELSVLKQFLDNSLDYILVINKDGKIVFSNASFRKSLGFTEEEISNKTIFEIVNLPQSELMRNIDYLIKKGAEIKGRRYYRDAFQNLIPVEIKAKAAYINSEPYIIVNARDVREILQYEIKHKKEMERLLSFYNFVNKLNLIQDELDLWEAIENYLLEKIDFFHCYGINSETAEIKNTYFFGDKNNWIDCLEKEVSSCQVFRTGKNFYGIGDIRCPLFKKEDDFCHLCFPLFFEGRLFGIVTLLNRGQIDEDELKFLDDILQTFNIYLNQIRLLQHLKDLALKDPLLNIYNRRFLMEVLRKEEEKAKREGGFFSLILLDVDHFKKINDTYGHNTGDKVLKEVSLLLSLNIREMDYLARWGGDEFLIFLPKTSKEEAEAITERLRSKIESYEFYLDERTKLKITISFGVAEFPRDGLSVDNLLIKADERLYKAKVLKRKIGNVVTNFFSL